MVYLELLAGFVLLIVAGDILVRGAVALALRLGVAPLIVGLTIVGFGTSAPELVVSLDAALNSSTGMAIGNIVGSNIANVFLVLGLPAMIAPTNCAQPFIGRNMVYVLAATVLFIVLCFNGPLHIWQGALLFSLIILFLVVTGLQAPRQYQDEVSEIGDKLPNALLISVFILAGFIGLPAGAHIIVSAGSEIARSFGVSDTVIGLTLVALGTSLPELAATSMAALRGEAGVALGNVLGSCLFNLLAIMGLTALFIPMPVPEALLRFDLWVMLAAVLVLAPFIWSGRKISRSAGVVFVLAYLAYIATVFMPRHAALAGTLF
jgi:cation:H+ antiporter